MSFKENTYQQLSMKKRFSLLYSEQASRLNTPVNVIIGVLIIKEMLDYSDDEMVENLMLDLHLQYALHTTSFAEQPLSDKSLSWFRSRCYAYETTHGVDLYHDCVKDLNSKIAYERGWNNEFYSTTKSIRFRRNLSQQSWKAS